jgi:AcrR family transcriptional regulator
MKAVPQKISIADITDEGSPAEDRTRAEIRRAQLLSIASELFGRKGFEPTSMRDIATAAGIMSGSLYYHFASKEDLYVAVMDASVAKLFNAVEQAIVDIDDPWQRLESAAVAHCEAMLSRSGFRVLTTYLSARPGPGRALSAGRTTRSLRTDDERHYRGIALGRWDRSQDFPAPIFMRNQFGSGLV